MGEVSQVELDEGSGGGQIHLGDKFTKQRRADVTVLQHVLEGGLLDVQLVPCHLDAPLGVRLLPCSDNVIGSDGECAEHTTNVEREDGS